MIRKLFLPVLILLLTSSLAIAQRTVSGTVSDDSGGPLPGASVLVKGTNTGTTTDFDGNYSITVPNDQAVLVFSFLGYKTKEVAVGNQATLNVTLTEDSESLKEVVVSVLGFKENRDQVASTYSVINAESVLESKEPTVINALAGKASGLTITGTSADPGAGSVIQIRGVSSINGSSPLIVVDGIPLNNSNLEGFASDADGGISQQSRLNDINPDDIESIQVFKGASAGALYGSRAIGGVIVITTKRGKEGKLSISLNSTLSIDKINVKHPLQTKFGQGSNGVYSPTNANSWGDKISDRVGGEDVFNTSGQYFEAQDGTLYYPYASGGKHSTAVYTDSNFDQVFQDGLAEDLMLNLSGGTEKATFYFSASKKKKKGIMVNSNYVKNTFTFGNTYKYNDWLSSSAKVSYTNSRSNR
ncbi:MAG: carboxypeptidase-like regulatory domain-containing protein, partial [Flavobacteriaceae bacterium]|nr:carboxypeptidase-like regulatory domain-containing protein [Flavobacteriaceae bacterium]